MGDIGLRDFAIYIVLKRYLKSSIIKQKTKDDKK